MQYDIIALPEDQWKGKTIPLTTRSDSWFERIGFDTCCYTNDDIGKKEVRLNLGYFFHREPRRR